jgi:lipid II:glycine glycyltransferase (peptidoglycan interpeptide bridge formation enzyme)
MIKNKTQKPLAYFRDIYNVFSKDNSIDLVFIHVDYQQYIARTQEIFIQEQERNDYLNELFFRNPKIYNQKINSDKRLQAYKEDVINATEGLKKNPSAIIAGALVIKHFNRIIVFASGYNNEFKKLNPNHYLYHAIFERYKPYFNYCDMNGVTYDFSTNSKYYGLNHFKLKFHPTLYEFIGELDLICNDWTHRKLMKTSFIEDEFAKFH